MVLLVICSCAYIRRIPKLKQWFLSDKKGKIFIKLNLDHFFMFLNYTELNKGFAGIFYKGFFHKLLIT